MVAGALRGAYADIPEAITGTYIDKKCPFTGNVSIRGRILTGVVHSTKMTNTIIIRREYLHLWVYPLPPLLRKS